jgi:hypothetical protein
MDLWHGALSEFVHAATTGHLAREMSHRYAAYHKSVPKQGEYASWENSLAALASVLRPLAAPFGRGPRLRGDEALLAADVGSRSPQEPSVLLEYHLPLSDRRIDVLLTGYNALGEASCLVVELKQWSSAAVETSNPDTYNVDVRGKPHQHPCDQAQSYADFLNACQGAFTSGALQATAVAYCHNLSAPGARALRDARYHAAVEAAPLFARGEEDALLHHVRERVGYGDGAAVLRQITAAAFRPGKRVLESVEAVLKGDDQWVLLDEQRQAFHEILSSVRRAVASRAQDGCHTQPTVIVVRGGPGTGKTVIAMELLAAALQFGWSAAHATGGKAFTTALRSKFKGADGIFIWNMATRHAPFKGLDLLLVDEAHRVRTSSKTRFTPKSDVSTRSQAEELIDAAKVTVFLLDENQFMRPDEIGTTATLKEAAAARSARVAEFDLVTQFRCGGATEYADWVDHLLHFTSTPPRPWRASFRVDLLDAPEQLDAMLQRAQADGVTARVVAGFCWPWSDPEADGALPADVQIGDWRRPWNRKAGERTYKPADHPYTRWAETPEGVDQVGCIYSAQGFEFGRVAVIWGEDLVWRSGAWVAQRAHSHDKPVARSKDQMEVLVRNAYRVLLTRGMSACSLYVVDPETRAHVASQLRGMQDEATA